MLYKFIGRNGSMGFMNGQIYNLKLYQDNKGKIVIESNKGYCPYSSMESFNKNWKVVKE